MSTSPIGIFVATMTGLAQVCAEEIEYSLKDAGIESEIHLMDSLDERVLDDFSTILIVSSTYGHGDIPDNGQAFYNAIKHGSALNGKQYAVFALGDRTYSDTFCHAGIKWDELLAEKGATSFVPLMKHDASSGTLAEDEAGEWATSWAAALTMAA